MKKKITGVLKVTVFLLLLVIGFKYFSEVLVWKSVADINLYNGKHFYENEEDSIDVIFYGNSHCFCTINNAVLYDEYGIASYNFAAGNQRIGSTYYFMKESLEYQSPKAVVVELYSIIEREMNEGDIFRNTAALEIGENYYKNVEYIDSITDGLAGEITDLVLQWPVNHTRYAELEEEDYHDFHYFQRGYRAAFANNAMEMPEYCHEKGVGALSEDDIYYLDQMIALADENNTELVFFVAPYVVDQEEQMKYNAVAQYLESKGVTFFNFTTDENLAGIDYFTDIWNTGHINVYGAEKVTKYLGEYLKSVVELPDRRGDEAYELWELDLKYFKRLVQENNLANSQDTNAYFASLATLDNLCVITVDGDRDNCEGIRKKLLELGVTEDVIQDNDVFIFAEGQLVDTMKKGDDRYYEEYQQKSVVITYLQDKDVFEVNIAEALPRMLTEGLNVYVYNEIDGKLLDVVGVTPEGNLVQ